MNEMKNYRAVDERTSCLEHPTFSLLTKKFWSAIFVYSYRNRQPIVLSSDYNFRYSTSRNFNTFYPPQIHIKGYSVRRNSVYDEFPVFLYDFGHLLVHYFKLIKLLTCNGFPKFVSRKASDTVFSRLCGKMVS